MLNLHNLTPLVKKRKRIGRGGSRGGTSGKGHKGQKARSGGSVRPGFEGGQMPLYRRLPKRGFNNVAFKKTVITVNVNQLENAFDQNAVITKAELIAKKVIKPRKNVHDFVLKILGTGTVTKKFMIHADSWSNAAKSIVEQAGGQIQLNKES